MFINIYDVFFLSFSLLRATILPPNTCARCSRFCLCCFCGGFRYDLNQDWLVVSECFRYIRCIYIYTVYYIYVCYQVTTATTMLPFILSEMILGAEITSQGARIRLISLFCIWGSIIPLSHAIQLKAYGICPMQRKKSKCKDFEDFRSHQQGFSKSRTWGFSKLSPFLLIVATSWQLTASVQVPLLGLLRLLRTSGWLDAFENQRSTYLPTTLKKLILWRLLNPIFLFEFWINGIYMIDLSDSSFLSFPNFDMNHIYMNRKILW